MSIENEYELNMNKKNAIIAYLNNSLKDMYQAMSDTSLSDEERKQAISTIMNNATLVSQDSRYVDYEKEEVTDMVSYFGFDLQENQKDNNSKTM